eukprot:SAG31_NODE_27055_length_432_cov_0.621622_1_plen_33_part_10
MDRFMNFVGQAVATPLQTRFDSPPSTVALRSVN